MAAVREACYLLKNKNIFATFIFSNCKEVVDLCSSSFDPPWEISSIIADARLIMDASAVQVVFVKRFFNSNICNALYCDFRPCPLRCSCFGFSLW